MTDQDVSRNAEFTLVLESLSPNTEGVFSVYPERAIGKTPVIIRVKDPDRLDYENEQMRNFEFNVVAETNSGVQIKSNVKVIVTDSNDNVPAFPEASYEFSVAEDAATGDTIAGQSRPLNPTWLVWRAALLHQGLRLGEVLRAGGDW